MSERDGELAAQRWFLAPRIQGGSVNITPSAPLIRDIAFYTFYRAGRFYSTEATTQLPSFGHHEG